MYCDHTMWSYLASTHAACVLARGVRTGGGVGGAQRVPRPRHRLPQEQHRLGWEQHRTHCMVTATCLSGLVSRTAWLPASVDWHGYLSSGLARIISEQLCSPTQCLTRLGNYRSYAPVRLG
jgi:hypothetical protein